MEPRATKSPGFISPFPHRFTSRKATHRVAHENIYRPDLACDRRQRLHGVHSSKRPRRRSMPRLVNAIANKSGGCERLPVAKERLFRGSVSVSEQCHRMRSRACRKELKRRRVPGERHFLDADARLNAMRERQTEGKTNNGCRGDKPVGLFQKTSNSGHSK